MAQITEAIARLIALAALAALSAGLSLGGGLKFLCGLLAAQTILDIITALVALI